MGNDGLSDNVQDLRSVLNSQREPMVELMLRIVQDHKYDKYLDFASTSPRKIDNGRLPPGAPRGSLEALHNTYHASCGGEGHMARVPVAAFDPIFWQHHW